MRAMGHFLTEILMKVLSTILALLALTIGVSSVSADASVAPSKLTKPLNTATLNLPPQHWNVFNSNACTICHIDSIPPIPGVIGRSNGLPELLLPQVEADQPTVHQRPPRQD
jgi:cytochrome c5